MTVYLDHAATTPILPEAAAAMTAQLGRVGNASSLHASGRDARRVVEESRETIARALSCRPGEVVFTSGGTESDNLAIKGLFWSRRAEDPRRVRILSTPIEHHAVLDPLMWLASEGAKVELVDVDRLGRLDIDAFRAAVESDPGSVALVTVMWANNEVGTVQPVAEVVEIAHAHGIPVHTDAVQALGQLPLDFAGSGVDAMTVTGHKIGGPYGVGALVVRRELQPTALLHGGGQERDIRSGTIDPPAIAGFAVACETAVAHQAEFAERLAGAAGRTRRRRTTRGAGRDLQRRPGARPRASPARQRAPRVPRLRGGLVADAARRARHRVLDRVCVRRRRSPGLPRPDGDGFLGGVRAGLAPVLPRAHLHAGGRGRPHRGDRAGRRACPQRREAGREAAEPS